MAVSRVHTLYAVEFNTTVVGGITGQSPNLGNVVMGEPSSGGIYNHLTYLNSHTPSGSFRSLSINEVIDNVPVATGYAPSGAGFQLHLQKTAEGGTRAGSTSHRNLAINEGLVFPTRLTCGHRGNAEIECGYVATYDGSNVPVVITDSHTLPTGNNEDLRFTLGPVTIESVTIPQVRSLEIDFGFSVRSEGDQDTVYDSYAYIESITPTITLRGIDIEWLKASNIPLLGLAATQANTSIYLRKRSDGGTFVADVTTEHILFNTAGMAVVEDAGSASGLSPAECSIVLKCQYDGTNAPLVVDTTSAIS